MASNPTQLCITVQSQGLPRPSNTWATNLIQARNPPPPFHSLVATAKARILASDWTTPALVDHSTTNAFPPNLANVEVVNARLTSDVHAQIIDIENLSKSRWEQVEDLEAIARGEQTRGREIIRLPNANDAEEGNVDRGNTQMTQALGATQVRGAQAEAQAAAAKFHTHRLVLQDCKGQKVFGIELRRIDRISIGSTNIGEKVILKSGATIARGTMLLEPNNCQFLGGKVEAWHKDWVEKRLARLKDTANANTNANANSRV